MRLGLGLGVNKGRRASGGNDPVIDALLAQATTDGYTAFSGDVLTASNTLVTELKSAGIWDKLDIFYVFATNGDSDFATYNWKNPSLFKITKLNSPTFTSLEGFTGNGSNMSLDTGYDPTSNSINYSQNSASFGAYVRTSPSGAWFGADAVNNVTAFSTVYRAEINGNSSATNSKSGAGFYHINRAESGSADWFYNGSLDNNDPVNSSGIPTADFSVLNNLSNFSTIQASVFFLGGDLSTESSDFYNSIQTYMSTIGTQV